MSRKSDRSSSARSGGSGPEAPSVESVLASAEGTAPADPRPITDLAPKCGPVLRVLLEEGGEPVAAIRDPQFGWFRPDGKPLGATPVAWLP